MSIVSDERVEELLEKEARLEAKVEQQRAALKIARAYIKDDPLAFAVVADKESGGKLSTLMSVIDNALGTDT